MSPGGDSVFSVPRRRTDLLSVVSPVLPETTCSWWPRDMATSLQRVPGVGGCSQQGSNNALWNWAWPWGPGRGGGPSRHNRGPRAVTLEAEGQGNTTHRGPSQSIPQCPPPDPVSF